MDESTAGLPQGWMRRAIVRPVNVDGRTIRAIARSPEDIIVSKLARLAGKDKDFVTAYHETRRLDPGLIEDRIKATDLDPAV